MFHPQRTAIAHPTSAFSLWPSALPPVLPSSPKSLGSQVILPFRLRFIIFKGRTYSDLLGLWRGMAGGGQLPTFNSQGAFGGPHEPVFPRLAQKPSDFEQKITKETKIAAFRCERRRENPGNGRFENPERVEEWMLREHQWILFDCGRGGFQAVFHAEAVSFNHNGFGVVQEAVQHG